MVWDVEIWQCRGSGACKLPPPRLLHSPLKLPSLSALLLVPPLLRASVCLDMKKRNHVAAQTPSAARRASHSAVSLCLSALSLHVLSAQIRVFWRDLCARFVCPNSCLLRDLIFVPAVMLDPK